MNISDFFKTYPKVAVAFSGGTDSAYLLYLAVENKVDVTAYYIKSQFQPTFEYKDALRLADELGVSLKVINLDILKCNSVVNNMPDRCYECKKNIIGAIKNQAMYDGYEIILDGTNASDDVNDRPGMKALVEYNVLSPLRICGLTKEEIRIKSKEAGLFTYNKPAYACLATRIKTGEAITYDDLKNVEDLEGFLFNLGFSNHRVRVSKEGAVLQIEDDQKVLYNNNEAIIINEISKKYNFLGIGRRG